MKFKFKELEYQREAVDCIADVFKGQPRASITGLTTGTTNAPFGQGRMFSAYAVYSNSDIKLDDKQLDDNIAGIRGRNAIRIADNKDNPLGRVSLDIEMETGTGKTYVYTKAIYELHERYGWTKYIIVTPSIAIREGVKKSLDMTQDHFASLYGGKKLNAFIYSSKNLTDVKSFASESDINVMIINMQAFNDKEGRVIYNIRDDYGSNAPIEDIAATRPILILDEPQKMGGEKSKTQTALRDFNPLFTLNFSATHAVRHRTIYSLDTVDAYNRKLVKRIEINELDVKDPAGSGCYLCLEEIKASKNTLKAKIELEVKHGYGTKRARRTLKMGDDLFEKSKGLEQYSGFVINEINAGTGVVGFENGISVKAGVPVGDSNAAELRRNQIRATVRTHLQKEQGLFEHGIKTLSLFFIDEVAKYRVYDKEGKEALGEYGKIFEEEYAAAVDDMSDSFSPEYRAYLDKFRASAVHNGYFSIDKHGHSIDSAVSCGKDTSDDVSAYDLILKNKEKLLDMEEPTRFIFSHSALREGWDNPNIFQICFLKKGGDSSISKYQEIGRGMRLAVNKDGQRMDEEACGNTGLRMNDVNLLTVIASKNYAAFVQKEILDKLSDRPDKADASYFTGQTVKTASGDITIDSGIAQRIFNALREHNYVEEDGALTKAYYDDEREGDVKPFLPAELKELEPWVMKLLSNVVGRHSDRKFCPLTKPRVAQREPLNERFKDPRFLTLWNAINHKYSYEIKLKSEDLIKDAVENINAKLHTSELQYTSATYTQENIPRGFVLKVTKDIKSDVMPEYGNYDLIKCLTDGTKLTRKTIVRILQKIEDSKFKEFARNPESFIKQTIKLINEVKADMSIDHIVYEIRDDERYGDEIFESSIHNVSPDKLIPVKKSIQDHVCVDSNNERIFMQKMETSSNVALYAKLPLGFFIPTPVGHYTPDWAVVFNEGDGVHRVYFIAETKGSASELDLRGVEKIKITCAKRLFDEHFKNKGISYEQVDAFDTLLNRAFKAL